MKISGVAVGLVWLALYTVLSDGVQKVSATFKHGKKAELRSKFDPNVEDAINFITVQAVAALEEDAATVEVLNRMKERLQRSVEYVSLSPEEQINALQSGFVGLIDALEKQGNLPKSKASRLYRIGGLDYEQKTFSKAPEGLSIFKPIKNFFSLSRLMFEVFKSKALTIVIGTTTTSSATPPTTGPTGPAGAFSRSVGTQTTTTLQLSFLFGSVSAYQTSFANSLALALNILASRVALVNVTDNVARSVGPEDARNMQLGTVTIVYEIQSDPDFTLALQAADLLQNTTSTFYTTTAAGLILADNGITADIMSITFGTTTTSTVRRLNVRRIWDTEEKA